MENENNVLTRVFDRPPKLQKSTNILLAIMVLFELLENIFDWQKIFGPTSLTLFKFNWKLPEDYQLLKKYNQTTFNRPFVALKKITFAFVNKATGTRYVQI